MTKFVFVHGRGDHGPDLSWWRKPVADALVKAYIAPPVLDGDAWIELRYDDLLNGGVPNEPPPWPDRPPVPLEAFERFAARKSVLEQLTRRPPAVGKFDLIDDQVSLFLRTLTRVKLGVDADLNVQDVFVHFLRDIRRYAQDTRLRRAVVHRLLDSMPDGEVVIIAHSLGTIAVLEMLPLLPVTTFVPLLITLGSPAAVDQLHENPKLAGTDRAEFPADRVGAWLNLVNTWDPVCLGGGLRRLFSGVVDHEVPKSRYQRVHDQRAYLDDPVVAKALELTLRANRSVVLHKPVDDRPSYHLPALLTVHYALLIAEAADDPSEYRRCRQFVREVLLPPLEKTFGKPITTAEVGFAISRWVGRGQPLVDRLVVLASAALSDPFSPFEPGITAKDRRNGLRDLAVWLGLEGQHAADIFALIESCQKAASKERRDPPWRMLIIATGVVASIAVAAPLAIGAFAATGAAGAATMTSGLAGLGLGGMAGGVSTIAAFAAGVGVIGGKVGGATPRAVLQDERAFASDLVRRAAMIRLLRGIDGDDARDLVLAAVDGLKATGDDLDVLNEQHRQYSQGKSATAGAVGRNVDRYKAVQAWLAAKEPADRAWADAGGHRPVA